MLIRIASGLAWFSGLGFGLCCAYGIWHLLQGRGIAQVMGFPTYGGGPFERFGMPTTVPLMVAFLLVCALECVAGWMLWSGGRSGALLALALLPIEGFFWYGFALPYGPVLGAVRTALILFAWSSLQDG